MQNVSNILNQLKDTIEKTAPGANLILFGSYARGEYHEHSDIDLLILLDKDIITRSDQKRIKYPLYDIEFETGIIISPMVLSKNEWNKKHHKTPFYENISKEGKVLI